MQVESIGTKLNAYTERLDQENNVASKSNLILMFQRVATRNSDEKYLREVSEIITVWSYFQVIKNPFSILRFRENLRWLILVTNQS